MLTNIKSTDTMLTLNNSGLIFKNKLYKYLGYYVNFKYNNL